MFNFGELLHLDIWVLGFFAVNILGRWADDN